MDNEDDEWVEVLKRSGLEGKHFEAKGVSRGEFEALKRFGDYKKLVDGTLMRIEGEQEDVPRSRETSLKQNDTFQIASSSSANVSDGGLRSTE